MSETDPQQPDDAYYLFVEIDNFKVTSLAQSIRLFKMMEQAGAEVAKLLERDVISVWPIYEIKP